MDIENPINWGRKLKWLLKIYRIHQCLIQPLISTIKNINAVTKHKMNCAAQLMQSSFIVDGKVISKIIILKLFTCKIYRKIETAMLKSYSCL